MTRFINDNGMQTAVINLFIDPQNGFLDSSLEDKDGGNLYVPGGEEVIASMGNMIEEGRDTIFVISQDYHPKNHISFMVNHPGVMDDRIEKYRKMLTDYGHSLPETDEEIYRSAQKPVHFFDGENHPPVSFPFPEIVLDEERHIFGLKEDDGRIRQVMVEKPSGFPVDRKVHERIAKVLDTYHPNTLDGYHAEGRGLRTQALWMMHCVQGMESSLYPDAMNFPEEFLENLESDLESKIISYHDSSTENEFWIIRKGMNSEIDSYGIGVENDGTTLTEAWKVFGTIADQLKAQGCQRVIINGGGLATNFCVEASLKNMVDFLTKSFKIHHMEVQVNFVPEISRGIPVLGGPEVPFSLAGAGLRLARQGIGTVSVDEILAMTTPRPVSGMKQSFPEPGKM